MIQVSYSSNIEDKYYKIIAQSKMQQYNNRTFESYYSQYVKSKIGDYELKDLLCGDYERLLEIKR